MNDQAFVDAAVQRAAEILASADALLVGAGAGMGVDSGLPDFRGSEGFWKAYPPFRGLRFAEVSNPVWFTRDPQQAWGFFGHRLHLYRSTRPHAGFSIIRCWAERLGLDCFVFTSNVDGQFQAAGFDSERIVECHGSIHYLQCSRPCTTRVWPADGLAVAVDEPTIRATSELPACPNCGAVARPNILMFGDYAWIADRYEAQQQRYAAWLAATRNCRRAVLELGAGLAVPTVRYECESRAGALIRINPRDPQAPANAVSLPRGALDALRSIDRCLGGAKK